jgi:hypothetical protein
MMWRFRNNVNDEWLAQFHLAAVSPRNELCGAI